MRQSLLAIALLGALSSAPLMAGQTPGTFYGGINAGWSSYEDTGFDGTTLVGPETNADNQVGGGVYGGYQINDWLGLDVGYDFLNDMQVGVVGQTIRPNFEVQGLDLSAKAGYPITDVIEIYGRAGAFYYQAKLDQLGTDQDGFEPLVAVGGEFSINKDLAARLEYQRVFMVDAMDEVGAESDIGMLSLGMIYRYGQEAYEPVAAAPAPIPAPAPKKVKVTKEYNIGSDVVFCFAKATLCADGAVVLTKLVKQISADFTESTSTVVGHADRIGTPEYNDKLSLARAKTVADFMIAHGISADKIKVSGRGENEPTTGDRCNKLGRAEMVKCLAPDRRVVVKVDGVKEVEVTQ